MTGYVVSKNMDMERAKEGTSFVYWSQQQWKVLRTPRVNDKKRKMLQMIRSKPKELYMRTIVSGAVMEFPLVTTQWEKAAEHAWIDNDEEQFEFRIVNRPSDPKGLNLAV